MAVTPTGLPALSTPMLAVKRPTDERNRVGGNWNPSTENVQVPARSDSGFAGHHGATNPALTRFIEPLRMSALLLPLKTSSSGVMKLENQIGPGIGFEPCRRAVPDAWFG